MLALIGTGTLASYEKIYNYLPGSQVTDHNALDLDQKALEADLAESPVDYAGAKAVYQNGGHSKAYAAITLGNSATVISSIQVGDACTQGSIIGKVKSIATDKASLECYYPVSDAQASYNSCKVGGLESAEQQTDGCMSSANIVLGSNAQTLAAADVTVTNKNGRTLQGFSTKATHDSKMKVTSTSCPGCPYKEFTKYERYFGSGYTDAPFTASGYGDRLVLGALDGLDADFPATASANYEKKADFSGSGYNDDNTRVEAAKKGSAYMNVYMYVIREFEDAIDDCGKNDLLANPDSANAAAVHAWDEGVAFYAGSLEGTDGSGSGKMLAALADKRCQNFGTCGPNGNDDGSTHTSSKVNLDLIEQFRIGRNLLLTKNCAAVRPVVDRIVDLMRVPLIQGTLRYAYKMSTYGPGGTGANAAGSNTLLKENAEGAVFAYAVLPALHDCSPAAAKAVYDNMKFGAAATTSKVAVKAAFEANYACLNIKCADVGALTLGGGCNAGDAWCTACADPIVSPTYEKIAGYAPASKVTDHNAIDLDQKAMEEQIAAEAWGPAKAVYTAGGNSKAYATFTVPETTVALTKGAKVSGLSEGSTTVTGFLNSDVAVGATSIDVMYDTGLTQVNYNGGCQVGGLATTTTTGCFAATKTIAVDWTTMTPTAVSNNAARTLQGFATTKTVTDKMWSGCPGCPYKTFATFYDYYGDLDYADKWVTAALDGTKLTFTNGQEADFEKYNDKMTRGEAAKKGSAYMNTLMYVIREFEDAIDDCRFDNITNNYDAAHAWDEGVAFYTGSLEGTAVGGNSAGKLAYRLAEKRCANFNTCGASGNAATGTSKVNLDLFMLFAEGQVALQQSQCSSVRPILEKITGKIFVPLIQGALRYAYKMGTNGPMGLGTNAAGSETLLKENAEGATFAAAVVPLVANCSKDDAQIIWDNLKLGAGPSTDKLAVKAAFERNYQCMGVKCSDVGALAEAESGDAFGKACADPDPEALRTVQVLDTGAIIGIVVACCVAVAAVLCIFVMICKEKKGAPIFTNLDGARSPPPAKQKSEAEMAAQSADTV